MYTIGQFAKRTGVTVRTLRFYDEKNLLKPSHLSESGRRYYSDHDLVILQNILTFKFLGYSLEHIQQMMSSQHGSLHQSLLRQKQEMLRKKEQLEKTIATLDHALALAEKEENVHTDIFLSLIHGLIMEEEQKAFLKTVLPETLVNDLYGITGDELVQYNKQFMEYATQLREAYHQKLPDEDVLPIVEKIFTILPQELLERTVETTLQIDEGFVLDESLFRSPFTKEEEAWLVALLEKMSLIEGSAKDEK